MARERKRTIELPWEGRASRIFVLSRGVTMSAAIVVGVVALVVVVLIREEERAGVRATRGRIWASYAALENYRADHPRACPGSWNDLVTAGYMRSAPVDAWGRMLRLRCPGKRDSAGMDVASDGPDGEYGGLDRVE